MEQLNEGITYVFGGNADLNGDINADWAIDFFYYKDTPLWNDIFEKLRNMFWGILRPIIAMFNK